MNQKSTVKELLKEGFRKDKEDGKSIILAKKGKTTKVVKVDDSGRRWWLIN